MPPHNRVLVALAVLLVSGAYAQPGRGGGGGGPGGLGGPGGPGGPGGQGGQGGQGGGPGGLMPGGSPGDIMPSGGGGGGGGGNNAACPNTTSGVDTVEVARNSDTYKMFFSGCPQYSPFGQTTSNTPSFQNTSVTFRVAPIIAAAPTYHSRIKADGTANPNIMLGPIGYAVNGIPIFNDADALGRDAIIYEGATLDNCRGHAAPGGQYHYHSEPGKGCVYADTAGKHSPLYGIMLDSIPIYGAYGDNGVAPTDLDECGGHTDATYSFYHYHVTANLAPPYITRCFRGCMSTSAGSCTPAATQYDYSPLAITWTAPFHVAHEDDETSSSASGSSSGGDSGTSPAASTPGPKPAGPRPEGSPAPGAKPEGSPVRGPQPEDSAPGPRPENGPAPGPEPGDSSARSPVPAGGAPGPRPEDGGAPAGGPGPKPSIEPRKPAASPKIKSRPSPRARPSPRPGKRGLSRRMIEA